MTITQKDHQRITERIQAFLTELEELGANASVCSVSCCVDSVGWLQNHHGRGDPMAGRGLLEAHLVWEDEDDVFLGHWDGPEDGDGRQEWPVEG